MTETTTTPTTTLPPHIQALQDAKTPQEKLNAVDRAWFSPDHLESGLAYLSAISSFTAVKLNFDPSTPWPAEFGLAIIPLVERTGAKSEDEERTRVYGVIGARMPTLELVMAAEDDKGVNIGIDFVRSCVASNFMVKLANAARPRKDGTEGELPVSVKDFIESRRKGSESSKVFSEIAPPYVKSLQKLGIKHATVPFLRNLLMSAEFARNNFPKMPQEQWVKLGELMIASAADAGKDPAIIRHWLDNRDNVTFGGELEELAGLFGEDDEASEDHDEAA